MKAKLISVGILFVVVMWFVVFVMNVNKSPVDHGMLMYTNTLRSVECSGWTFGMWSDSKCENVATQYSRYADGHLAVKEIMRTEVE